MTSSLHTLTVQAQDASALARFWGAVLDWQVVIEDDEEVVIRQAGSELPGICFLWVPGKKTGQNRLHIDLKPDDQDAEVDRIIALGARRADVGQGDDVTWVVLADPEGNEFCVLRPRKTPLG